MILRLDDLMEEIRQQHILEEIERQMAEQGITLPEELPDLSPSEPCPPKTP